MGDDERYFYPHFGTFNNGSIQISPTFAGEEENALLRALSIKHTGWTSNVVRLSGANTSTMEYRGICEYRDSGFAGICALTVLNEEPFKMVLQLEPADSKGQDKPITSLVLKRDPPGDAFVGWVLRKSIDVSRDQSLYNLKKMAASSQDETEVHWDLSQNSSMIKNSGEFREFVMEYMERDALAFEAAESKLGNLTSFFRIEKDRIHAGMQDISREVSESKSFLDDSLQSASPQRHHLSSPSRRSPQRSGTDTSLSTTFSANQSKVDQSHTSAAKAQMDSFQSNVEQSIDRAFSDSLGIAEDLMIKLYYTGKDPRARGSQCGAEYEYTEEGKNASAFEGYVQDRSAVEAEVRHKEASMAAEALREDADYQQLKRALARFQGDVEQVITQEYEEHDKRVTALGWEEKVRGVGVTETPQRAGTRGKTYTGGTGGAGMGRWDSAPGEEEEEEEEGEGMTRDSQGEGDDLSVEEEVAEVQALLSHFLKTHHREEWGHTKERQHTHHAHPHYPSKSHPHYMQATESSTHHEVDLHTKLHTRETIEMEECSRSLHHQHQHQMHPSVHSDIYGEARRHDHHHGVFHADNDHAIAQAQALAAAQAQAAHAASSSKRSSVSSTRSSVVGSSTSRKTHSPGSSSVSSTTSSTISASKSSPTKKITKVSSRLLAPTASSKAASSSSSKTSSGSKSTSSAGAAKKKVGASVKATAKDKAEKDDASVDSHSVASGKTSLASIREASTGPKVESSSFQNPVPRTDTVTQQDVGILVGSDAAGGEESEETASPFLHVSGSEDSPQAPPPSLAQDSHDGKGEEPATITIDDVEASKVLVAHAHTHDGAPARHHSHVPHLHHHHHSGHHHVHEDAAGAVHMVTPNTSSLTNDVATSGVTSTATTVIAAAEEGEKLTTQTLLGLSSAPSGVSPAPPGTDTPSGVIQVSPAPPGTDTPSGVIQDSSPRTSVHHPAAAPVSAAVIAAATQAATASTMGATISTSSSSGAASEGVLARQALLEAIDVNLESDEERDITVEEKSLVVTATPEQQEQQKEQEQKQQQEQQQEPSLRPPHDSTWSPPTEHYLLPTFTSLQMEQDDYTKLITRHMIEEEGQHRAIRHEDLLDPEHAFRRDRGQSLTSELSDWTVDLEEKKDVKKLKKSSTTKKSAKKKASK